VTPETVTEGSRSPDRFSTTRWSVVLACADSAAGEETARKALADLEEEARRAGVPPGWVR